MQNVYSDLNQYNTISKDVQKKARYLFSQKENIKFILNSLSKDDAEYYSYYSFEDYRASKLTELMCNEAEKQGKEYLDLCYEMVLSRDQIDELKELYKKFIEDFI